jgi:phage terminase small subunit
MLNPKQKKFAYLMATDPGLTGTAAAIEAGYAKSSAAVTASRLLRNDKVQEEIRAVRNSFRKQLDFDQAEVMRMYQEIADASIEEVLTFGPATRRLFEEEPDEEITEDEEGNKVIIRTKVMYVYASVQIKPIEDVPASTLRAIKKISQTQAGVSVEFHDKKDAMAKLNEFFAELPAPPGASPDNPFYVDGKMHLDEKALESAVSKVKAAIE